MTTIFERLNRGRPAPIEEKTKPQPMELAQKLLEWLQRRPGNIVSSRDIRIWGPLALHNKERAIQSAQILVAHGHLTPITDRKWQVIRKPLTPASRL